MQMTESEIKRYVLDAADQKAQVKICAELNATDVETIRGILKHQGVDLRRLRGAVKKRIVDTKPRTKSSKKTESAADKQQITVAQACVAIRAELERINQQQYELDMRKADLYKKIWDMLGEGVTKSE